MQFGLKCLFKGNPITASYSNSQLPSLWMQIHILHSSMGAKSGINLSIAWIRSEGNAAKDELPALVHFTINVIRSCCFTYLLAIMSWLVGLSSFHMMQDLLGLTIQSSSQVTALWLWDEKFTILYMFITNFFIVQWNCFITSYLLVNFSRFMSKELWNE